MENNIQRHSKHNLSFKSENNISEEKKNEINIIEKPTQNLNEFRLIEAKKSLQIYDNEKIGGKEYELKCRRILNLMLLFIQKDNYKLSNPHKIPIQNIINFLKIKELENVKLTDSDAFEIDVVINDFKIKDLNKLLDNYTSHFFFTENLDINNDKENVNFIGEISKNFLIQISNKFEQIKTYFAVFKILDTLNSNNNITDEEKQYILSFFDLKNNNNKNIFVIITDGSYFIIRFIVTIISLESKNIQSFIKEEINKNTILLNYIMAHKFRNLNNIIYQTFEALKYLEDNNIKYCIFFIGDKENNRFENFYKEKLDKIKEIKFETKFKYQLKVLINKLIESKEKISYEITQFGKKIKNTIYDSSNLHKIIFYYPILYLPNYFKIELIFYFTDKNLKIEKNNKFNINFILLTDEQFVNKYKKLIQVPNIESLYVFIVNKNILTNSNIKKNNKIIIIKENLPNIYNNIMEFIKENQKFFEKILKQKIAKKSNELNENKKINCSKCELTLKKVIEKLKGDNDLCFQLEKIVNFLYEICEDEIGNEIYINELIENKNVFENMLGKTFIKNFKDIISNNFVLLEENIKSSIIYDYITKDILYELVYLSWHKMYILKN